MSPETHRVLDHLDALLALLGITISGVQTAAVATPLGASDLSGRTPAHAAAAAGSVACVTTLRALAPVRARRAPPSRARKIMHSVHRVSITVSVI